MRISQVFLAAAISAALSCGSRQPAPATLSSTWSAPTLLSHVPADTPYVLASLAPANEAVRKRLLAGFEHQLASLEKLAQKGDDPAFAPWVRAGLAIASELRGKDPMTWWQEIGLDPNRRFVAYGLSIWPVVRFEVANPAKLRALIERALAAAGTHVVTASYEGHPYWAATNDKVTVIAAVLDREAVAAIVPSASVGNLLPQLLGSKLPDHNLADAPTLPDLLGRYRLLSFLVAYFDFQRIVDIVTEHTPGDVDPLLHQAIGQVPPTCGADLGQLAASAPRLVFGYRRLDEAGFDGFMLLETPPSVAGGLKRLHTAAPEVTTEAAGKPLLAIGAAVDPEALISWLRGTTGALRSHPYACPWLAGLNEAGSQLAGELDKPLPPIVRGVRGFALVLERAGTHPLQLDGHLLVSGSLANSLVSSLSSAIPFLAGLGIKQDGQPVELPARLLDLPVSSAHAAMNADRVVVATGPNSAQRATEHLGSPVPKRSPLFVIDMDGPRMQQLLAAFDPSDNNSFGYLGNFGMALDAVDEGVQFNVWGTWPPLTAEAAAP